VADKPLTTAEKANKIKDNYNFILVLLLMILLAACHDFWKNLRKVIKDSKGDQNYY
jgi:hypothetical protein